MKICVIGSCGVVGSSTFELFKRLGYDVVGVDKGDLRPLVDITFICTSEDSVEEVFQEGISAPLVVVRSSVLPGTCNALQQKYRTHVSHNPEFLRQAVALQDELNPDRIIIGQCCQKHGDLLEQLYKSLQRPIVRVDPATSELVKIAANAHLSCLISYWNTIEQIAKRIGVSGHQVGMIASLDPRISPYGSRLHQKYSGHCLPKDIRHLIEFAQSVGYEPILLKAVEDVNEQCES